MVNDPPLNYVALGLVIFVLVVPFYRVPLRMISRRNHVYTEGH